MPEDYRKVVFDVYKRKKFEGDLSSNLLNPTPGNLRAECLIVCRERYNDKDHEILRLFFDGNKEKGYIKSIENSKAQSLRQMSEILKGADVKNPGVKYFELLAWLIGLNIGTETSYYKSFYDNTKQDSPADGETKDQPKVIINENLDTVEEPYLDLIKTSQVVKVIDGIPVIEKEQDKETTKLEPAEDGDTKTKEEEPKDGDNFDSPIIPNSSISFRHILISCTVFMLIGIGVYQFRENKSNKINAFNTLLSSGNEKCMYWTGDHYQAITCGENLNGFETFPINTDKIANFKRITQPDTLTKNALGKTWYAKREGRIEFYTDSGDHPTDANKRLLPVTTYILNKYISYHRYLLKLIFWSAGIIIFSLIFGIGAIYLGRKVKKQRIEAKKQKLKAAA